jgi:glycosyltransferase involved in cell wall biosynthesis
VRIAILQGAFLPVPTILGGAVEKMWFSLGKEFARQGHDVLHVSRLVGGLPSSETIEDVQHIRIPGFNTPRSGLILKFRDLQYTLRTRSVFSTEFDVIISNTFWAPIFLPKRAQQVCVVDVQRMPKKQMWLYRHVARLRANSSAVVTAIQHELPEHLHQKVIMIPNPLPFVPTEDVDSSQKKPVILYVGRIHPEKGLDLLIKAYRQTNQQYCLKLVGPYDIAAGGGGIDYLNTLKTLAGPASVEFTGPIYDIDALNRLYAEAPIFVYPSIAERGETFGLAPLEAMAWGCTPIVSDLACFKDFIVPQQNGLIFDHRAPDAITQLARHITYLQQDHIVRERLGKNATQVRQTHSIEHIARLFLTDFQRLQNEQHGIDRNRVLHA